MERDYGRQDTSVEMKFDYLDRQLLQNRWSLL